jgi:hypothetical protein
MKKKKYLDFYKKCMKTGYMPKSSLNGMNNGLCGNFGEKVMEIFEPTIENCREYCVVSWGYWAADRELVMDDPDYWHTGFGPTRQNIILFLAAMNNEL